MASQCTKAQAPRLRAARVVEATEATEERTPEENPSDVIEVPSMPVEDAQTKPPSEQGHSPDPIYESDEEFYDVEGSQFDPQDDYAAAFSDHGEADAWFGSMRIVTDDDLDVDLAIPVNSSIHPTGMGGDREHWGRGRLMASDLSGPIEALTAIPRPTVEGDVSPESDFSDLPELTDIGDEMSAIPAPPSHWVEPFRFADDLVVPLHTGIIAEQSLNEDLDWAWPQFVNSERTDEDLETLLVVMYRMVHQNNHLIRSLLDSRNSTEALTASLSWTRRELAVALFRESEGLSDTRLTREQRRRIRSRVLTETRPLEYDVGDEPDDSHRVLTLAEANDLLLDVLNGRGVPEGQGIAPPDYDRICRTGPWFGAMRVTAGTEALVTRARAGRRPLLSAGEQECIVLLLVINGLGALTLCDAGSTTEMLSNDFARIAQCEIIQLENPATLQLGCAGSRSRINFGTRAPVTLGQFGAEVYFDIANLDRYDAVLGTPFLRRFGVMLDFKNDCVHIDGQSYPALSRAQVNDVLNKRGAKKLARERPSASNPSPAPYSQAPTI